MGNISGSLYIYPSDARKFMAGRYPGFSLKNGRVGLA